MSESSIISKSPSLLKILAFAQVTQSTDPEYRRVSHLQRKYEGIATDFNICLDYCKLLGFVEHSNDFIKPKGGFNALVSQQHAINPEQLKKLVIESMLSERTTSSFMDGFFYLFNSIDGSLVLNLSLDERLKYSDLRNLFLELGLIRYYPETDTYKVVREFASQFQIVTATARRRVLSDDQLLLELEKQRELGLKAELLVIEFERKRLETKPEFAEKIEHVAKNNVGAGYDISSWELDSNSQRYIEVKAVPQESFRFYWSSNEIDMATQYKEKYYLYLLPVRAKGKITLKDMEIIKDPYKSVFLDKGHWTKKERLYTIWKSNGS
ncbi:MAG: DUF3883 domain-containing protein [Nitrosotalea sp.]